MAETEGRFSRVDADYREGDEQRSAMDEALKILARKAVTSQEVRATLHRKGFSRPAIEMVIARLEEMEYLNDAKYARDWIQNRIQFNPAGKLRLRHELLRHGVPRELVDECLEEAFRSIDEIELAVSVARKVRSTPGNEPRGKAYRSLWNKLAARGFDCEIIRSALNRLGWDGEAGAE